MPRNREDQLVNLQAQQLAAQVANWAAQLEFQKERMRLLELPEMQARTQAEIDRLAFEKSQAEWQRAFQESSLTGTYNGQPTLQWLTQQAQMTGVLNGQQTLQGKLTDAQIAQMNASMANTQRLTDLEYQKFGFSRQQWDAEHAMRLQNQQAQLTGYINGLPTFERQQWEQNNRLAQANLIASLAGPASAFKQVAVIRNLTGVEPDIESVTRAMQGALEGRNTFAAYGQGTGGAESANPYSPAYRPPSEPPVQPPTTPPATPPPPQSFSPGNPAPDGPEQPPAQPPQAISPGNPAPDGPDQPPPPQSFSPGNPGTPGSELPYTTNTPGSMPGVPVGVDPAIPPYEITNPGYAVGQNPQTPTQPTTLDSPGYQVGTEEMPIQAGLPYQMPKKKPVQGGTGTGIVSTPATDPYYAASPANPGNGGGGAIGSPYSDVQPNPGMPQWDINRPMPDIQPNPGMPQPSMPTWDINQRTPGTQQPNPGAMTTGPYSIDPPGTQANPAAYNYEPTNTGGTNVYPPGVAAPYMAAQASTQQPVDANTQRQLAREAGATGGPQAGLPYEAPRQTNPVRGPVRPVTPQPINDGKALKVTDPINRGLLPHQINARNYNAMTNYEKEMAWAGFEAGQFGTGAWDKGLAKELYQRSLPKYAAPKKGTVRL